MFFFQTPLFTKRRAYIYIYKYARIYLSAKLRWHSVANHSLHRALRSFFWIFRIVYLSFSLFSSFFRENSRFRRKRVGTIFSFRTSMARLANRKIQTVFPIRTFFRSHDFSGFVSAQLQLCEIFHDTRTDLPIYLQKNPFPRFKIPSIHFGTKRLMQGRWSRANTRTWSNYNRLYPLHISPSFFAPLPPDHAPRRSNPSFPRESALIHSRCKLDVAHNGKRSRYYTSFEMRFRKLEIINRWKGSRGEGFRPCWATALLLKSGADYSGIHSVGLCRRVHHRPSIGIIMPSV